MITIELPRVTTIFSAAPAWSFVPVAESIASDVIPHVNIGPQFQAAIPSAQSGAVEIPSTSIAKPTKDYADRDEMADLVWKPEYALNITDAQRTFPQSFPKLKVQYVQS